MENIWELKVILLRGSKPLQPWRNAMEQRIEELRRAVERYERRYGKRPKNEYGVSLYRLHIRQVLDWFNERDDLDILWVGPRYMPEWMRWIEHVPGVREVVTWNLVVIFRRKHTSEGQGTR